MSRRETVPGSRDAEATRRALFAAATRLFAERGYDGAKVEAIAAAAGVNKAMINYHFGGKRKLHAAILLDALSSFDRRLVAVRRSSLPPGERLREFIAAFGEAATEQPFFPAMLLREALAGGHRLDRPIRSRLFGLFGLVREIVTQGVEEGAFRPVDPFCLHLGLIGSLVFFFATEQFRRRMVEKMEPPVIAPSAELFCSHLEQLVAQGILLEPIEERAGKRRPSPRRIR
jgi:TetR/AcrR family transcriptional regulator